MRCVTPCTLPAYEDISFHSGLFTVRRSLNEHVPLIFYIIVMRSDPMVDAWTYCSLLLIGNDNFYEAGEFNQLVSNGKNKFRDTR